MGLAQRASTHVCTGGGLLLSCSLECARSNRNDGSAQARVTVRSPEARPHSPSHQGGVRAHPSNSTESPALPAGWLPFGDTQERPAGLHPIPACPQALPGTAPAPKERLPGPALRLTLVRVRMQSFQSLSWSRCPVPKGRPNGVFIEWTYKPC